MYYNIGQAMKQWVCIYLFDFGKKSESHAYKLYKVIVVKNLKHHFITKSLRKISNSDIQSMPSTDEYRFYWSDYIWLDIEVQAINDPRKLQRGMLFKLLPMSLKLY